MPTRPNNPDKSRMQQGAGERIRWVRDEIGETQAAVAAVAGVTQATWNRYERGVTMPDPYLLVTFCAKFRVSMDYVYRGLLDGVHHDLALRLGARHPTLVFGPTGKGLRRDNDIL